jgi:hypothetical protein
MPIKRYKPEQIVPMLRQIEVGIANAKRSLQSSGLAHARATATISATGIGLAPSVAAFPSLNICVSTQALMSSG